jgi:uncharacterized metal-binding protein YceD (DUF177 family)
MMPAPLTRIFDLSRLSDAGAEIIIQASTEQRGRLADWAGVDAVERFDATVTLKRNSATHFAYDAALSADIVQSCVVTLEPVHSHLELNISRTLHLNKFPVRAGIAAEELSPVADEGPEEIEDPHYDLAGPLLEEFVLAIDPYPRAAGVMYQQEPEEAPPESPFAALRALKRGS